MSQPFEDFWRDLYLRHDRAKAGIAGPTPEEITKFLDCDEPKSTYADLIAVEKLIRDSETP
jgi:hypothetical protein